LNSYSSGRRKSADVQIAIFQYLSVMVFLWLLAGFWQLQVHSPEIYAEQAARNRIKSLPLPAPRGKILDRDGRILVDNTPSFKLRLSRTELNREHLPIIAEGLNIPYDKLLERLDRLRNSRAPEYQSISIKEDLSPSEVAFVEAHKAEFPELELIRSQRRLYPQGGLAAHVVGYVGEVSEAELHQADFVMYDPGTEVGKAGVERRYNDILVGTDGSRQVMVDSRGRSRGELGFVDAIPGRSLRLTIDLDLQVVAELAMDGRRGAVVALDPNSGEVLALVSSPNYDPNHFVGGISSPQWRELTTDPDKPLLNRAIQAQLAPGSTFKPMMAMAALESGVINEDFRVFCNGGATHYGHYYRCWQRGGHGWVGLREAIVHSCDVFFYAVGDKLGIDRIAEYATEFGLGRPTGIDLPNEEEGTVPSSSWKIRLFRERWYAGETISVSIGQGALTVTPLQLAYAIGGLAMGGVWQQPRLISDEELHRLRPNAKKPEPRRVALSPAAVEAVVGGMWGVVNAPGGTGARAHLPGYDVCGKTGTAQRVSNRFAATQTDEVYKDDAWFVAFAPCQAPEIVVTALYENGEHSYYAAPIVRDVIKAYFDKKERQRWTRQPPAAAADLSASAQQPAGRGQRETNR
jgi:penicillin-binding protein 2